MILKVNLFRGLLIVALSSSQFAMATNQPELSLENFTHTATITLYDDHAVAATLVLPSWSYLASHQQLRDLRVFNAAGLVVAHQLLPQTETIQDQAFAVNAVALPAAAKTEDMLTNNADIKLDGQGELSIKLKQQVNGKLPKPINKITQWILNDTKLSNETIKQLSFEIRHAEVVEFSAEVDIETSADLRTWQTLVSQQKILNYGKQHLAQLSINIPATQARYWRIKANGADLTSIAKIWATARPKQKAVEESLTVDCQLPDNKAQIICLLPNLLPITSAKVEFGKQHVAFNARIDVYDVINPDFNDKKIAPKQTFFALLSNAANDPVVFNGAQIAALVITDQQVNKLSIDSPPQVNVKWSGQQLKFLVNGSAPFSLAVGADNKIASAEQFINVSGKVGSASVGQPQIKSASPIKPVAEQKPWLLWSLLGIAVICLSAMAMSLLRQNN